MEVLPITFKNVRAPYSVPYTEMGRCKLETRILYLQISKICNKNVVNQ